MVAQALKIFGLGLKNNSQSSPELTIKKEFDTVSHYLHKIIEARDYLLAAEVYFADEDIVILALNDMPHEYVLLGVMRMLLLLRMMVNHMEIQLYT